MSEIKVLENGNVLVTVPITLRFCSGRKRVVFPENDAVEVDPLVMNIARAFRWRKLIDSGFAGMRMNWQKPSAKIMRLWREPRV